MARYRYIRDKISDHFFVANLDKDRYASTGKGPSYTLNCPNEEDWALNGRDMIQRLASYETCEEWTGLPGMLGARAMAKDEKPSRWFSAKPKRGDTYWKVASDGKVWIVFADGKYEWGYPSDHTLAELQNGMTEWDGDPRHPGSAPLPKAAPPVAPVARSRWFSRIAEKDSIYWEVTSDGSIWVVDDHPETDREKRSSLDLEYLQSDMVEWSGDPRLPGSAPLPKVTRTPIDEGRLEMAVASLVQKESEEVNKVLDKWSYKVPFEIPWKAIQGPSAVLSPPKPQQEKPMQLMPEGKTAVIVDDKVLNENTKAIYQETTVRQSTRHRTIQTAIKWFVPALTLVYLGEKVISRITW